MNERTKSECMTTKLRCCEWEARAMPILAIALGFILAVSSIAAGGQEEGTATSAPQSPSTREKSAAPRATPLADLLKEVRTANPQIIARRHAWQAAKQVPSQVSTLPDPQITVQQFAVGSPRPFSGFSNSDFAYIGAGVSQDLPYPGKLRVRGEIARREAASSRDQLDAIRRSIVAQLKATYFRLAYVQKTLGVLERDRNLLEQIEKVAETRYQVGQGNQQDVLKAQLQQTKVIQEVEIQKQERESLEAQLKQILNRAPNSPDITAEAMTETPFPYTSDELLNMVRSQNPDLAGEQEKVRRQSLQVELARKDFYPDFNVQYMWQHTARQFRDYYMLSFGVKLPIWRSRKQRPELAQAVEELDSSRREYEARVQQTYFEVQDQFVQTQTGARLLKIYREGLIPQATATFEAGLASYQTGHEDFQTLLNSFLDVLNLDIEYWRTLADRETALARLEQLTGITLP